MSVQGGKNRPILPATRVTSRVPRSRKFHMGEKRAIDFWGWVADPNDTSPKTWAVGIANVYSPSGAATPTNITPSVDGKYEVLVDFNQLGVWEVVLVYGTSPASASELLIQEQRVRVVT